MLADREAEKDRIVRQLATRPAAERSVVPHPTLVRRYEEKVGRPRETLNDDAVMTDAMKALRSLIGSVTVHTDDKGRTMLDVEAFTATLIDFAGTKESPRPGVGGYFN